MFKKEVAAAVLLVAVGIGFALLSHFLEARHESTGYLKGSLENVIVPDSTIHGSSNFMATKGRVYLNPYQALPEFMTVPLQFPDHVYSVYEVLPDGELRPNGLVGLRDTFKYLDHDDPELDRTIESDYRQVCPQLDCPIIWVQVTSVSIQVATGNPDGTRPKAH